MNPSPESTATECAEQARQQIAGLKKKLRTAERRVVTLSAELVESRETAARERAEALLQGNKPKPDRRLATIQKQIADAELEVPAIQAAIEIARHRLIGIEQDELAEDRTNARPAYSAATSHLCNTLCEVKAAVAALAEAAVAVKSAGVGGERVTLLDTGLFIRPRNMFGAGKDWFTAIDEFLSAAVAAGYWDNPDGPERFANPPVEQQEPSDAEPGPDAPAEFHREYWDGQPIPGPAPKPVEWDEAFWKDTTETLVDAGKPSK